jgi:hypothetical protein
MKNQGKTRKITALLMALSLIVLGCEDSGDSMSNGSSAPQVQTVGADTLFAASYFERVETLAEDGTVASVSYEKVGRIEAGERMEIQILMDENGEPSPGEFVNLEGYNQYLRPITKDGQTYYANAYWALDKQRLGVVISEEPVNIRTGFRATDLSTISFSRGSILGVAREPEADQRDLYRIVGITQDENGKDKDYLGANRTYYMPKDAISLEESDRELMDQLNSLDPSKEEIWEQILLQLKEDYPDSPFLKEVDEKLMEITGVDPNMGMVDSMAEGPYTSEEPTPWAFRITENSVPDEERMGVYVGDAPGGIVSMYASPNFDSSVVAMYSEWTMVETKYRTIDMYISPDNPEHFGPFYLVWDENNFQSGWIYGYYLSGR